MHQSSQRSRSMTRTEPRPASGSRSCPAPRKHPVSSPVTGLTAAWALSSSSPRTPHERWLRKSSRRRRAKSPSRASTCARLLRTPDLAESTPAREAQSGFVQACEATVSTTVGSCAALRSGCRVERPRIYACGRAACGDGRYPPAQGALGAAPARSPAARPCGRLLLDDASSTLVAPCAVHERATAEVTEALMRAALRRGGSGASAHPRSPRR